MSNTDMIADNELSNADNNIQVSDCYIIVDLTLLRVNEAQSDMNMFANSISKKQAIRCALEKVRQQSNTRERCQPKFSGAIHLAGQSASPCRLVQGLRQFLRLVCQRIVLNNMAASRLTHCL